MITSPRLTMRLLELDDAEFVFNITHDPDWLKYIGDRGFKDVKAAAKYVEQTQQDFVDNGVSAFAVLAEGSDTVIGLCGFFKRPFLNCWDFGYAFLPQGRGMGYALEATQALLHWAEQQALPTPYTAICHPDNLPSQRILKKLGFEQKGMLYGAAKNAEPQQFYIRKVS